MTLEAIIDPRGQVGINTIGLSPRPDMAALKAGPILFYDNTKLDFCNYAEIFTAIKRNFRERGICHFSDFRQSVRGSMSSDLAWPRPLAGGSLIILTGTQCQGRSPSRKRCTAPEAFMART